MSHDVLSVSQARALEASVEHPRSETASRALPVSLRVPNPPPLLVGRERVVDALKAWVGRSPIVGVVGPAGIGKTALALHVLHEAAREGVLPDGPRVYLHVGALLSGALWVHLRKVLALGEIPSPDWSLLSANPQEALAALIELADRGGWTFLLDDVDGADADAFFDLMDGVSRYARRSRWLWTARHLEGQGGPQSPRHLLGPMDDTALLTLARALDSNRSDASLQAVVSTSEGSPRKLISLLHQESALSESTLHQVRSTLRWFQRPLSGRTLAAIRLPESGPEMQYLQERGEVLRTSDGLVLRRVDTHAEKSDSGRCEEEGKALARALEEVDEDDARMEAIRLWLQLDAARACRMLDAHAYMLCERGFAPDLWLMLDHAKASLAQAPGLMDWKDWCAFEWGDAIAFQHAGPPEPDNALRAHLLARHHLREGRLEASMEAAACAVTLAESSTERNLARVRGARAAFSLGRTDAVESLCDACEEPTGAAAVEVAMLRAECAALHSTSEESGAQAERLLALAANLSPALRLRVYLGAARVHLMRQRLRDAERVMDTILTVRAERAADALSGRTAVEIAAAVAIQRGRFQQVRELAQRLERAQQQAAVRQLFTRTYVMTADEWQAPHKAFRAAVRSLIADCEADGGSMAGDVHSYGDVLRMRIAIREGEPPEALAVSEPARPVHGALAESRDLVRAWYSARWGMRPEVPQPSTGGMVEHQILRGLVHACVALVDGDFEDAESWLRGAEERADQGGYTLHLLEILRLQLLCACGRGAWEDLEKRVERGAQLARALQAPRLQEEVDFFAEVASGREPHPTLLERWAADTEGHPSRMRWSRWWLGETGPLDRLEEGIWSRCEAVWGWARARRMGATEPSAALGTMAPSDARPDFQWTPSCGIDAARRVVWCGDAVLTDLSRHDTLFAILTALFRAGGSATKEVLVCSVWGVTSYHPLHHDNRLRVAVRKLRARLGDGSSSLLETLEDGYALRGVWRWVGSVD